MQNTTARFQYHSLGLYWRPCKAKKDMCHNRSHFFMDADSEARRDRERLQTVWFSSDDSDELDEEAAKAQFSELVVALTAALESGDGNAVIIVLKQLSELFAEMNRHKIPAGFVLESDFPTIMNSLYFCDELNDQALGLCLEVLVRLVGFAGGILPLMARPEFFVRLATNLKSECEMVVHPAMVLVKQTITLNKPMLPLLDRTGIIEIVSTELCVDRRYNIRSFALFILGELVDVLHDEKMIEVIVSVFISGAMSEAEGNCMRIRILALAGVSKCIAVEQRCIGAILDSESSFMSHLMLCVRTGFGNRALAMLENNALKIICQVCHLCTDEQLAIIVRHNLIEFVLCEVPFFDVNIEAVEAGLVCDKDSFDMVCQVITMLVTRCNPEIIERLKASQVEAELKLAAVKPALAILITRSCGMAEDLCTSGALRYIFDVCEGAPPSLINELCDTLAMYIGQNQHANEQLIQSGAVEFLEKYLGADTTPGDISEKCTLLLDRLASI